MQWTCLEKAFHRALVLSVSKRKLILTVPALVLCGILIVFCRAVAFAASDWVALSLAFLPILLSSGILLAVGILLVRLHYHEAKQLTVNLRKLLSASLDVVIGTSYLAILPVLAYLLLWVVLGVFFLLKEIPHVGDFFSVVFSFGPFLLILGSLFLCFCNLALLFFIAPAAALQSMQKVPLAKRIFAVVSKRILSAVVLFFIALIPLGVVVGILSLAAILTNVSFSVAERSLSVALEWFFIMLPFCAILSPAVVFFFNFAAESFQILREEQHVTEVRIPVSADNAAQKTHHSV